MEEEEEKWKREGAEGEEETQSSRDQREKEDGCPQVHGVNLHLGSHMMPPLHKAHTERQTDEQTDKDRRGEEGGETGSVSGRRDKQTQTQNEGLKKTQNGLKLG